MIVSFENLIIIVNRFLYNMVYIFSRPFDNSTEAQKIRTSQERAKLKQTHKYTFFIYTFDCNKTYSV